MFLTIEVVVGDHLVFVSARPSMWVCSWVVCAKMDGKCCQDSLWRVWAFWKVIRRMSALGGVRGSPQWWLSAEGGCDGCVGIRGGVWVGEGISGG